LSCSTVTTFAAVLCLLSELLTFDKLVLFGSRCRLPVGVVADAIEHGQLAVRSSNSEVAGELIKVDDLAVNVLVRVRRVRKDNNRARCKYAGNCLARCVVKLDWTPDPLVAPAYCEDTFLKEDVHHHLDDHEDDTGVPAAFLLVVVDLDLVI
jgi:hypothetical protein